MKIKNLFENQAGQNFKRITTQARLPENDPLFDDFLKFMNPLGVIGLHADNFVKRIDDDWESEAPSWWSSRNDCIEVSYSGGEIQLLEILCSDMKVAEVTRTGDRFHLIIDGSSEKSYELWQSMVKDPGRGNVYDSNHLDSIIFKNPHFNSTRSSTRFSVTDYTSGAKDLVLVFEGDAEKKKDAEVRLVVGQSTRIGIKSGSGVADVCCIFGKFGKIAITDLQGVQRLQFNLDRTNFAFEYVGPKIEIPTINISAAISLADPGAILSKLFEQNQKLFPKVIEMNLYAYSQGRVSDEHAINLFRTAYEICCDTGAKFKTNPVGSMSLEGWLGGKVSTTVEEFWEEINKGLYAEFASSSDLAYMIEELIDNGEFWA